MRMKQLNYWPKYWGVFGDMNKNRDAPPPLYNGRTETKKASRLSSLDAR